MLDGNTQETLPADTGGALVEDDKSYGDAFDRIMTNNGADRGEAGKFASPNAEGGKAAAPPAASASDEPSPAAGPDAAPSASTTAPAHWPAPVKAAWEKMEASVREAVSGWSAEQDKKFGDLGRQMSTLKPVNDVLGEFAEYFDGRSGSYKPHEAVRYLFNVQKSMDRDPEATILQIADTYGVRDKLAARLGVSAAAPGAQDGTINTLQAEVQNLKAQLARAADPGMIDQHVNRAFEVKDTEKIVRDFGKSKEFYDDLEADIADVLPVAKKKAGEGATPVAVLELAYEMALSANPEVREKVRAAQAKAAATPDPKRIEGAKRASGINVKSTATGNGRVPSEDEILGAAYDRALAS